MQLKRQTKHFSFGRIAANLLFGIVQGVAAVGFLSLSVFLSWKLLVYVVSPDINKFIEQRSPESSVITDNQGRQLYEYYNQYKRQEIPLEEISPHLINATLAVEDKSFYQHNGLWLPGIVRAALLDVYYGEAAHGGSTITQQLVKNVILIKDKSVRRKLAEIVWAIELEKRLSKKEILEKYLNLVPYGRNSAGAKAGSKSFFGLNASALTVSQAAFLASLPKAPSSLSPDGKGRSELNKRQTYVLELMQEQNFISIQELEYAKREPVKFVAYSDLLLAPHFVFLAIKQTKETLGEETFRKGGLIIQTTLSGDLQTKAEYSVEKFLDKNDKKLNAHNTGLVAIAPDSGKILAYVGSRDYFGPSFPAGCKSGKNCLFDPKQDAIRSPRQTGSSFKPYVYVTAFGPELKLTPVSKVADIPKTFRAVGGDSYSPRNYTGASYGWITTRKALAGSLNVAAVNLLAQVGIEKVVETVKKLGVTANFDKCGLSMALGACEMTLLEHASAFSGLVNLGKYNPYTSIEKIATARGKDIYQYTEKSTQAVEEPAAYELIDILSDNKARSYIFGDKSPLAFDTRKVAVKTGTTQNWKDGWTVGGTPQIVTGVWIGNSNGQNLYSGADSIISAAPLWRDFLDTALANLQEVPFREPFGISRVAINSKTGKIIKPKPGQTTDLAPIADYALNVEAPKVPKPKVAGAKRPDIDGQSGISENTVILSPWANQVITASPFDVKVYVGTSSSATSVILKLDGKIIGEKSEAPFLFTVQNELENGWHTLEATATHFETFEDQHSIRFRTHFNPPPLVPRGTFDK